MAHQSSDEQLLISALFDWHWLMIALVKAQTAAINL